MLQTPHVTQIATTNPATLAFRITSGVEADEFTAVAEITNAAMDRDQLINLLFILQDFGLSDAVAGLSLKSLGAQMRSATHLERYAVVGAPAMAAGMIETFDKISTINARTFEPHEEDAAWAFVGARPVDEQPTPMT
jgi:hypothetical protein